LFFIKENFLIKFTSLLVELFLLRMVAFCGSSFGFSFGIKILLVDSNVISGFS